jgi:anaerobic magnesium-protoporphyrin IX monomethyl ester cyclase
LKASSSVKNRELTAWEHPGLLNSLKAPLEPKRVVFLQNVWEEHQGPLILAEILERIGHEVRFFLEERNWLPRLIAWRPDVVAASVTTGMQGWFLSAFERIKAASAAPPLTVMGGSHPTFFPEIVEHPAVDAICLGEAETAFPDLLASMSGSEFPTDVPNFWVKQDGRVFRNELGPIVTDLDQVPFSRRSFYRDYPFLASAPCKRIITSRGCPFKCTHCFNHAYRQMIKGKGPYVRRRSVGHVIAEIEYIRDRFRVETLEFGDDVFTADKKWFLEFCREYNKRIDLPFWLPTHANFLDEEIADALQNSKCRRVAFGIESGNRRIREEVLDKPLTEEAIRKCARLLHERKIRFQTLNMVGMPGETIENAFETVRLNQELKPYYAWCSIVQPYPRTRLEQACRDQKLLLSDSGAVDATPTSFFAPSVVNNADKNPMNNLQKFFGLIVRHPVLEPLVRRLIKRPPNKLFKLIHQIHYGYHVGRRNGFGLIFGIRLFFRHRRHF